MSTKCLIFTAAVAFAVATVQAQKSKTHFEIDPAQLPPPAAQKGVTYAKDVRPIFETSCVRCHGQEKQKAELRLDSLEAVLKGSENGKVVIPGDSAKSRLVIATSGLDEESAMPPRRRPRELGELGKRGPGAEGQAQPEAVASPPPGVNLPVPPRGPNGSAPGSGDGSRGPGKEPPSKPLTREQVGLIRAWIEQGAK